MHKKKNTPMLHKLQKYLRRALIFFFASTILSVVILKWCPVYVTPLMLIRCAQQVSHGQKIRMRHHWVPLDQGISIYMPVAVIASAAKSFTDMGSYFDPSRPTAAMSDASAYSPFAAGAIAPTVISIILAVLALVFAVMGARSKNWRVYGICIAVCAFVGAILLRVVFFASGGSVFMFY